MRYTNAQTNQEKIQVSFSDGNYDLAMFWTLRAIFSFKFFDSYFKGSEFNKNGFDHLFNTLEQTFHEDFPKKLNGIKDFLEKKYLKLQCKNELKPSTILAENIENFSSLISLNKTEKWILIFAILSEKFHILENLITLLLATDIGNFSKMLSIVLMMDEQNIKYALSDEGNLYKTGILKKGNRGFRSNYFSFSVDNFSNKMTLGKCDIFDTFKNCFFKSEKTHLSLSDFLHMDNLNKPLLAYLKNALTLKKKGCNVLIYGAAGTGKTQYARLLSDELKCKNYEISFIGGGYRSLTNSKRFRSYLLANEVLKDTNSLILFDEIEDLFQNGNNLDSDDFISKALFNKTLESNNRPTIWLSNSIDMLDRAYIRRFDFVYEMPLPPRFKKEEILRENFGDLLSKDDIQNISEHTFISPAILTRVSKVLHSIKDSKHLTSKTSFLMLNETLKAQGYPQISPTQSFNTTTYDTSFVNTDVSLSKVMEGIKLTKNARICLFGKPGTGKSEYCKYIAKKLDKPIYIKKASDILSPYVGMAEKNMADAFDEAKEDGAVLVFDEVDSFLQDRRRATKSWEISTVNEMLTQMESYNGIFFATTNLSKSLDCAALRRFDMKLEFGYLNEKQSLELLKRHLSELNLKGFNKSHKNRILALKNLTPGDFHTIRRQMNFYPATSIDDMIKLLEKECELKEEQSFKVGFLS